MPAYIASKFVVKQTFWTQACMSQLHDFLYVVFSGRATTLTTQASLGIRYQTPRLITSQANHGVRHQTSTFTTSADGDVDDKTPTLTSHI